MKPNTKATGKTRKTRTKSGHGSARKNQAEHGYDRILYLASLIDNVSDALISTDLKFNILEWNAAAENMYGWTAAEVTGHALQEFIQVGYIDTTREEVIKAVLEQGLWKGEVTQNRKAGSRFPVLASVSLVKDKTGEPIGFVAINRDITERKQAEEKLQKSEQTFSVIFNKAPFAAGLTSLSDGAYLEVNEEFERVFRFSREEIIGQSSLDLGMYPDPEVRARSAALFRKQGFVHNLDMRLKTRTDEIRDVLINSDLVEIGGEKYILTTANDITERKQAEDELREQQSRQKNILDGMLTFVGLISLDGILLEANRAALAAVGLKAEDIIGKPLAELDFWAPSQVTQARVREAIRRAAAGELVREDFLARIVGDRVITVDILFNPLRDASGNIVQVVASGVDVTERKRAEESLRENESRLQSIIDTEPECVKVLDLDGRLLEMNPAGLAMIEADSLEDVMGHEVADLVVPQHRMAFRDLTHSISEGRSGTLIFEIEGLKGTHRWLETHAVPLRDHTGTVKAVLGITLDVTERKRAELQIQRQIQHLRALRTIDSAITSSFDLRLTLGVLLGEVISQLGVDAADVLLFNQPAQVLEYADARGFHSDALQHSQLRLGEGFAGRAVLERRTIHIPNIMEAGGNLVNSLALAGEAFLTYFGVPLLAKGQIVGVLEIFQRSALEPDAEWLGFLEALAKQAAIAIDNAQLLQNLQRSNNELIVAYDATLDGWSRAMDLRDRETEGHTQRVTQMALQLSQFMGLPEADLLNIRRGGMLHDIGKLGVPDSILLKPDKLTDDEWEAMRLHPKLAYDMLTPISYLRSALDIPYCHHEKWDGTGYPRGLKGEHIPRAARIFAIVDVWDAITSNRPYRSAWSKAQALDYIQEQSGKYFDPQVVDAFIRLIATDQKHM